MLKSLPFCHSNVTLFSIPLILFPPFICHYHILQVLAVESAKALFIQLRSETTGGAGLGRGIETERDVEARQLKERVESLVIFASMIRSKLNKPNTPIIMARIEDSLT